MTDAFIYDHARTPRGRGKPDGALHEVTALDLATHALAAIKDRNQLKPTLVDDVVMGCVDPIGEAGGVIPRAAALKAGYGDKVPGVQISRFCASGLDAINFAGGLLPTAAPQNIRLVRPAPPGACCEQTLPVNIAAIISGGDPTTNYQLMPGDRLVVYRDPIVRATIFLDRVAAPFQTVVNTMLQYSFMARSVKSINVPIFGGGI